MKKVNIGDIWLVLLPKITMNNKETSIKLEKRPCLIIDDGCGFIINKNNDYLGLKIASKNKSRYKKIKNWYELGLKKESYLRIEIPIKIEKSQLLHKIGHMDKYDLYLYLNDMIDYLNIDLVNKIKGADRKI